MNPWQLYDELIGGIPGDITVTSCNAGYSWATVISSENHAGIAKTIPVYNLPFSYDMEFAGSPLKQIAALSKSWNFIEAAIGVAAIGAYYNPSIRSKDCGVVHPGQSYENEDVFDLYSKEIKGLKVAVIGHFPSLEKKIEPVCDLTILERDPSGGDLPDPACEYILGEQDYVIITGCALVNKTMPRLLELSKNAKIVVTGPSTIMSPIMFKYGVYGLSGMIVHDAGKCDKVIREGKRQDLFKAGEMVNRVAYDGVPR